VRVFFAEFLIAPLGVGETSLFFILFLKIPMLAAFASKTPREPSNNPPPTITITPPGGGGVFYSA
jgi:hypothetical protein